MNKKNIASFAFVLLFALPLGAQSIKINADWEFQRLKKEQQLTEIKNQGSDWSSQFNIQHVEAQNQALAVHPDTLELELNQLSMGKMGAGQFATYSFCGTACCTSSVARDMLLS